MDGEPKEAYVSGRVGMEERTRRLVDGLTERGYKVTLDWTGSNVRKPYLENREHNAPIAIAMLEAAGRAKVFVLLVDKDLKGAWFETAAAMVASLDDGEKRLFIVGDDRESIF